MVFSYKIGNRLFITGFVFIKDVFLMISFYFTNVFECLMQYK